MAPNGSVRVHALTNLYATETQIMPATDSARTHGMPSSSHCVHCAGGSAAFAAAARMVASNGSASAHGGQAYLAAAALLGLAPPRHLTKSASVHGGTAYFSASSSCRGGRGSVGSEGLDSTHRPSLENAVKVISHCVLTQMSASGGGGECTQWGACWGDAAAAEAAAAPLPTQPGACHGYPRERGSTGIGRCRD